MSTKKISCKKKIKKDEISLVGIVSESSISYKELESQDVLIKKPKKKKDDDETIMINSDSVTKKKKYSKERQTNDIKKKSKYKKDDSTSNIISDTTDTEKMETHESLTKKPKKKKTYEESSEHDSSDIIKKPKKDDVDTSPTEHKDGTEEKKELTKKTNVLWSMSTEHVTPLKNAIDALKDLIAEANLEIIGRPDLLKKNDDTKKETKKKKSKSESEKPVEDGRIIRIMSVDQTRTAMICMKLKVSEMHSFEYNSTSPSINIGININMLYNILKPTDKKDDILTIDEDISDRQKLNIDIFNQTTNCRSTYKLKLLELDIPSLDIPTILFEVKVTMPSLDFHKLCKDMSRIAEYIKIICTPKMITFSCKGDSVECSREYHHDQGGVFICQNDDCKIFEGDYDLGHLISFSKCANLCEDILIFLRNDFPIFIRYTIATLGDLQLGLAQTQPLEKDASISATSDDEPEA